MKLLFNLVDVKNVKSTLHFHFSFPLVTFSHVSISSIDVFFCVFRECLSLYSIPGAGMRLVLY